MTSYILYGSEMSYFSGKARAYLRWKGVDFEERNSDATFYAEVCIPRIGYGMIPLLITPSDDTIQDSTLIMDHFENMPNGGASLTPRGPIQNLVAHMIELYADDWLLVPAMHYRWEYDADATVAEFALNMMPDAPLDEQHKAGAELAETFRNSGPILGIHPHTKAAVEESWRGLLSELDTHFRQHAFLLGDRPSTADFALIGPLYAHMYRDTTAGALMRKEAIAVAQYVERVMFPRGGSLGEYLANDQIPETLIPVLARMMREQMPCIDVANRALADWKANNPDTEIPRMIGEHSFQLEGETATRGVFPYPTWLFGRARAAYDSLRAADRVVADAMLDACGGSLFRDSSILEPVAIRDFKLVWA